MDLLIYSLRSVAYVLVEPSLIFILIMLGIVLYSRNRKVSIMQRMIIGERVNSPLELTLSEIVLGIIVGTIVSIVLAYLGITFQENSGIEFLFVLSIVLMFIKPRWICFSYSGAILGFLSLIFTYFNIRTSNGNEILRIDILMLMTFIAVLHIAEGFLVMIDGDRGSLPVFSNKDGKIIGGYALKRNWILPVAIFIAFKAASLGDISSEAIATPSWWPLMSNDNILSLIENCIISMTPFFAILGYSDVTFTRIKKRKAYSSGIFTLGYGVLLLIVAQITRIGLIGEILVLIFAPVAHELMLYIQKQIEQKRTPIYVSGEKGVSILEVVPGSIAYKNGIKPGDRIYSINDKIIESEVDVYNFIKDSIFELKLKINGINGEIKDIVIKRKGNSRLGLVLVPKMVQKDRAVSFDNNNFSEVLNKIKNNKNK